MFGQITELLVNILSELRQLNEREISWMKEVREKDKLTELRQDTEWAYLQAQWKRQEEREEAAQARAQQNYETIMTYMHNSVAALDAKYHAQYIETQQATQPLDKQAKGEPTLLEQARAEARRLHKKLPTKVEEDTSNG